MKTALAAALAAAALALPALAHAQDDGEDLTAHYSRTFTACTERSSGADMIACADTERKRWDVQLNAAYHKLMARLPAARGARLRDEERAWIPATKAKCDKAREDMDGVPVQKDTEQASCMMDETIKRTLYLRAYR